MHDVRDICPPPILPIKDGVASAVDPEDNQKIVGGADSLSNTEHVGADIPSGVHIDATLVLHAERNQPFSNNDRLAVTTGKTNRKSRKSQQALVSFDEKDLRGIVAPGHGSHPQIDPYHALMAAGHIKNSAEFLPQEDEER